MKTPTLITLGLFLFGVVISLMEMWFQTWPVDLFVKMIITNGALFVVSFVIAFLIKEGKQSKKIEGEHGLD